MAEDRQSLRQVLDQTRVPSTGAGARFELQRELSPAAMLRLGADWRMTQGRTQERYLFIEGNGDRYGRDPVAELVPAVGIGTSCYFWRQQRSHASWH